MSLQKNSTTIIAFVLVLALGLGVGWILKPSGQPTESTATDTATASCESHGVAEDLCTRCNPALIAGFQESGDWCAEHHVPESQCYLCNANLAEQFREANDWCNGHGVPESQCTLCNPELIPAFQASGDWCGEHRVPESQCGLCGYGAGESLSTTGGDSQADDDGRDHTSLTPSAHEEAAPVSGSQRLAGLTVSFEKPQPLCPTDGSVIQFASVETAARVGLRIQPVLTAPLPAHIEAPAEVVFDETATTLISSTLPIAIRRWLVEPGTAVSAGQAIAEVESPDAARLAGDYVEAYNDARVHIRELERAAALIARGLIDSAGLERTRADAAAAEGRAAEAESRLSLAGLADAEIAALREGRGLSSQFLLRASADGLLLERDAPLGRLQEAGTTLGIIGKPDAVWIEASIRDRVLGQFKTGDQVEFLADGRGPIPVLGEVIWVSQFLDPHTRTGIVRVRPISETNGLRAHEFGRIHVVEDPATHAILIPRDAVQWEGCCNVVFVEESPDRFRPRKVSLERAGHDHYRVITGLLPNENIVVDGSFLLKTELKKGSIGAGCCGLDPTS